MAPWIPELCSDIRPVPLDWLWPGYLARGKVALLDGDPEVGKSVLTLDLIARLGRGGPMPDGSPVRGPGTGVVLTTEDGAADTIRPRAEAAGADLDRLVIPRFVGRAPQFPDDLPALEELLRDSDAELAVLDPLMAFLPPRVAANLDQCVRRVLTPLADLAGRTGCAILLVRHLGKRRADRALWRGLGSVGIGAAARTVLFAAAHPADPDRRVLAVAKSNVGRRPPALGFRVVPSPAGPPVVAWAGPEDLTADGLCRGRPPAGLRARDRAVDWLRRELAGGPRRAAEVYAAAAAAGIPERTLERAKRELRAASQKVWDRRSGQGDWYWYDPAAPWPAAAPFERPIEFPPLPGW